MPTNNDNHEEGGEHPPYLLVLLPMVEKLAKSSSFW
jgi:hypothetical protein